MMKPLQIQIVILSLFLFIFSSGQETSDANGGCKDFTYGDCSITHVYETVNDMNTTVCQKFCQEIFSGTCLFWSLDYKQKMCNLYDSQFDAFAQSCSKIGGPPFPRLTQCQSDSCNVS